MGASPDDTKENGGNGTAITASASIADSDSRKRLRLDLAYDGTHFHGWATQPGLRTVQQELEGAVATLARTHVPLTVAGRTDAGVHARHQVVHADFPSAAWDKLVRVGGETDRLTVLVRRLNTLLARAYASWAYEHSVTAPKGTSDVCVHCAHTVTTDFDARFAASGREYAYRIVDARMRTPLRRHDVLWVDDDLDIEAMNDAARPLIGCHDFLSYCRPRQGGTTIRTLTGLDVGVEEHVLVIRARADAFCHSMVRSLVGALLEVGRGRKDRQWPAELLAAASRATAAPIAPAHGLTLEKVTYPPPDQWAKRVRESRRRRDQDPLCGGDCDS